MKTPPSFGEVSNLLRYEDGLLIWRIRRGKAAAGGIAGRLGKDGYIQVGVSGAMYMAHRLIWLLVHGTWPSGQIDHINGNRSDNRLENLRDVSPRINGQNKRCAQGPGNQLLGTTLHKRTGKWQAAIKAGQKFVYLGLYETPEEAHAAYVSAKRQLHEGCTL